MFFQQTCLNVQALARGRRERAAFEIEKRLVVGMVVRIQRLIRKIRARRQEKLEKEQAEA